MRGAHVQHIGMRYGFSGDQWQVGIQVYLEAFGTLGSSPRSWARATAS